VKFLDAQNRLKLGHGAAKFLGDQKEELTFGRRR